MRVKKRRAEQCEREKGRERERGERERRSEQRKERGGERRGGVGSYLVIPPSAPKNAGLPKRINATLCGCSLWDPIQKLFNIL